MPEATFKSSTVGISGPQDFPALIKIFTDLIALVIPVLAGLALLAFFWGLVKFIAKAGDAKTHAEGRNLMVWGLIALFAMVSVWGIIAFLSNEIGFRFVLPLLPQ